MRAFIVVPLLLAPLHYAADSEYAGTWRLNPARSDVRTAAVAPASLVLTHEGSMMRCQALRADGTAEDCSYTIDVKETRRENGRERRSTVAKWEGLQEWAHS